MENYWFILIITLCISAIIKSLFNFLSSSSNANKGNLPPGPSVIPIIGNLLWLRKSFSEIESILRNLKSHYGPLITLRIGSRPSIFVGTHSLAHKALVQNGAVFSDRPKALPLNAIFSSNQHNISSAFYGPTWRLLRRNLTSEILHPSRVKSYSRARRWVLGILFQRFLDRSQNQDEPGNTKTVVDHFRYAMFCLLLLMCFGDKLKEDQIQEIESLMRKLLLNSTRFNLVNLFPRLGKILFRNRWKELLQLREDQEKLLIPLIRARIEAIQQSKQHNRKEDEPAGDDVEEVVAYVDTLVGLTLPEEKRELNEGEMVTLCSEFLNAGTDTTSTALQWIMANLVKYPDIQDKLYGEIVEVVGPPRPLSASSGDDGGLNVVEEVKEEDLQKIPYLKAVVLEGLRRHPPGHFVLPHSVKEDVELDGYIIPKNSNVNFMVADIGWDPKVWESPMEFKPERFLEGRIVGNDEYEGGGGGGQIFDITGSKEIKMMPFGAGRRICPGLGLALLHLEYFVANLVWQFEWKAVDGEEVDLSEKLEFTVVMKNPLRAHISPRVK